MARDQNDSGQFEWVNAWAATTGPATSEPAAPPEAPEAVVTPAAPPVPVSPEDQLKRAVAEIARRRDALNALAVGSSVRPALALVSNDKVPAIVGGVLALVIITVFGAVAAMSKLH
jgi:hypothetical protein